MTDRARQKYSQVITQLFNDQQNLNRSYPKIKIISRNQIFTNTSKAEEEIPNTAAKNIDQKQSVDKIDIKVLNSHNFNSNTSPNSALKRQLTKINNM